MSGGKTAVNLIFLEFVDEAKTFLCEYLKDIHATPENFQIVSFHPLVDAYMKENNVSSISSFHFCLTESHGNLLAVLEEYTEQVREHCVLQDSTGVEGSYVENLLLYLRVKISVWLYRVEVISNAIECYQPKTIIISIGSKPNRVKSDLWTEPILWTTPDLGIILDKRYITEIIEQICLNRKIILKKIQIRNSLKDIKWKTIKNLISVNMKNIKNRLKREMKILLFRYLEYFVKPCSNMIIVPSEGYNIDCVLEDLRKELNKNYDLTFLEMPWSKSLKDIFNILINKTRQPYRYLFFNTSRKVAFSRDFVEQKKIFCKKLYTLIDGWTYRSVSPASWLKQDYEYILERRVVDKTYYQAVNLNKFLDVWKPVFVLSQFSRGMTAVMGELCKIKQIPSLMIPHGSFTPIQDKYSKKEWKENALGMVNTPYKYLALQTPLIEEFIKNVPVKSMPIITGPLLFGRKIRNHNVTGNFRKQYAPNDEKIVLHASTPKHRKGQRLFTYETLDEYVDGLYSLVETVGKIKGVHLIIRYRPAEGLEPEKLRKILPESKSYSLATTGSFNDYLSIADILVSYSSTTIEDALQNNIPVLIYSKYNRYKHIGGIELMPGKSDVQPSPVYNVNSETNLLFSIRWILENHLSRKDSLNNLFDKYKYKSDDVVKLSEFIGEILEGHKSGIERRAQKI